MAVPKHVWFQYRRVGGYIIEIIIRDASGAKIDVFKCNNEESLRKALNIMKNKYGIRYKPKFKQNE